MVKEQPYPAASVLWYCPAADKPSSASPIAAQSCSGKTPASRSPCFPLCSFMATTTLHLPAVDMFSTSVIFWSFSSRKMLWFSS